MKVFKISLLTALTMWINSASAQQSQVTSHYRERIADFAAMRKIDSTDVVMLGNSLTEFGGDWNRLLRWRRVRNRGISGDDATGILHRLGQILPGKPKAIFLMVGINDLSHDPTRCLSHASLRTKPATHQRDLRKMENIRRQDR